MKLTNEQLEKIESCHNLIIKIALEYYYTNEQMITNKKLDIDDIQQVAFEEAIKLVKAHKQDSSKFTTYLCNYLALKIQAIVAKYSIVKIPIQQDWDKYHKENTDELRQIYYYGVVELDAPVPSVGEDTFLINIIEDELSGEDYDYIETMSSIERILTDGEYDVFKLKVKGHTDKQIGDILNINSGNATVRMSNSRKKIKSNLNTLGLQNLAK